MCPACWKETLSWSETRRCWVCLGCNWNNEREMKRIYTRHGRKRKRTRRKR
jgi:hypothetical protein